MLYNAKQLRDLKMKSSFEDFEDCIYELIYMVKHKDPHNSELV
jgi:hypothetical protein